MRYHQGDHDMRTPHLDTTTNRVSSPITRHATPCLSCGARWINVGTSNQARHHTSTCALRTNQNTTTNA